MNKITYQHFFKNGCFAYIGVDLDGKPSGRIIEKSSGYQYILKDQDEGGTSFPTAIKCKQNLECRYSPREWEIETFVYCSQCLKDKPPDVTPREWAQLDIGWTKIGLQIWCRRHECNIAHINFQGISHPAEIGSMHEKI